MKTMTIFALILATLIVLTLQLGAESGISRQDLQQARSLVKVFAGDLKSALIDAMEQGGPVNAVDVCNLQVEPIAEGIAAQSGWKIGRTSLKVRNEKNVADEWELKTLLQFEQRKLAGEDLKTIEHSELVSQGEQSIYRYMQAIPAGGLCLTCHGSNLDDQVSKKLNMLYPNDQAIGYSAGDLRGAFTMQKVIK